MRDSWNAPRYISIKWVDEETVRSITESRDPLKIENTGDSTYKVEASTYSKIDNKQGGQLAFHILDIDSSHVPAFTTYAGDKIDLVAVENAETKKVWWVENGKWNKKFLYKDSPICRTAGETKIIWGDVSCLIRIHSLSFTFEELDLYLSDFRNDLWDLILKENSYISADAKTHDVKIATDELIEHLKHFIKFAQKIIDNPKKELKESQSLQAAEKVRPIPRTFMEIATKGYSKLLTGRDYIESYDVAENKYVYSILCRVSILVDNLLTISEKREQRYKLQFDSQHKRLDQFSDTIKIDKDVVNSEISDLEKSINRRTNRITDLINESSHNSDPDVYFLNEVAFKVTRPPEEDKYNNTLSSMWTDLELIYEEGLAHKTLIKFDYEKYKGIFQSYGEYKMAAYVTSERKQKRDDSNTEQPKDNYFWITEIKKIITLEICSDKYIKSLNKLKKERDKFNNLEWVRPITRQEKYEQEKDKKTIHRKIELLNTESKNNLSINKSLIPLSSKLKKLKKQFSSLKVGADNHFPGSMTFIQNPNYQGVHSTNLASNAGR